MFRPHEQCDGQRLQPVDSMKTTLLFLSSLTVSPAFNQFFEYQNVSLSCGSYILGVWTVWRYTNGSCGVGWGQPTSSGCHLSTIKLSDSGVYWCESECRESSNAVNITVTGEAVILQSPVLPVTEGDDVTLHCKTKNSSKLPAKFFKGTASIDSDHPHLLIYNISRSEVGAYWCTVGGNRSPTSWLLMRDDVEPTELMVSPDSSQMYEYKDFELSCGENSSSRGWRVFRARIQNDQDQDQDQELSHCGDKNKKWGSPTRSGCRFSTALKKDSATYWCESLTKQRSNSVNIVVHSKSRVILQCPVLPVTKGDNVTLYCLSGSSQQPADFYKAGDLVRSEPGGHMTIYDVSTSDEGQYKCVIGAGGGAPVASLPSQLYPNATATAPSFMDSPVLTVLRHVVVVCPYLICTGIRLSLCRHRKTGRKPPDAIPMSPMSPSTDYEEPDPSYDDVIPDVTTEHHF
ncbi:sialoadhesin-like [Halichoeres trimaculatus]|uniref:sialoadhesin-like n=1 Tax=Halichoeres trimaculatus TaxID=147232 RepID=UPI003D9FA9DC